MELLGVLSDSHDQVERVRRAASIFRGRAVTTIVHCGDITTAGTVAALSGLPVHWVFGNCDWSRSALRTAMLHHGHLCHGRRGAIERAGLSIAFTHGDDAGILSGLVESGSHHLVLHGHTHLRELRRAGATTVLNPGALHHADPPGCAIVRLPSLAVEWIDLR